MKSVMSANVMGEQHQKDKRSCMRLENVKLTVSAVAIRPIGILSVCCPRGQVAVGKVKTTKVRRTRRSHREALIVARRENEMEVIEVGAEQSRTKKMEEEEDEGRGRGRARGNKQMKCKILTRTGPWRVTMCGG